MLEGGNETMIDSKPAGTNQPASGAPAAVAATTRLGHVHLWTKSIPASTRFYRDVLGFQEGPVSTRYRIGEVGLGADQPHVIAFNTWHGEGARAPPADAHGLRYFTVVLPDAPNSTAPWSACGGLACRPSRRRR